MFQPNSLKGSYTLARGIALGNREIGFVICHSQGDALS